MTTNAMQHHDNQARMAALEQRVVGIEDGLRTLTVAVKDVGDKIQSRSATNWPVIWSAAGVSLAILLAIGGLASKPIEAAIAKSEAQIERIRDVMVTRSEHERQWRDDDRELDRMRERMSRNEKTMERIEDRLARRMNRLEEPSTR